MLYPVTLIKRATALRRLLKSGVTDGYAAGAVSDAAGLRAAKQLHADVYVKHQFIELAILDRNGTMPIEHDPYQQHADYFAVTHQTGIAATARQIRVDGNRGHRSFPALTQVEIYPRYRLHLETLEPSTIVEISGLAKRSGHSSLSVLMLYRAMWHQSRRSGHKVWLMACDEAVYSQLKRMFGKTLTEIGPATFYMGSQVIPAMLELDQTMAILAQERRTLNPVKRHVKGLLLAFLSETPIPKHSFRPKFAVRKSVIKP